MRHAKAARLAALLVALGAGACEGSSEPGAVPGGGNGGGGSGGGAGGTGGTGGTGGGEPQPPASWETAEIRQRWMREGLGWGMAAIAHDWDGDGNDELVVGGRGALLIDPAKPLAEPIWSLDWEGGTEWETSYGFRRFDGNGDGVQDILAVASDRAAYLVDGKTGERIWYRHMDNEFLPARIADYDADDDGVPDLFSVGDDKVWSGATGELLHDLDLPIIVADAETAELDGEPGRDLLISIEKDGVLDGPDVSGAQIFAFAKGEKLWEAFAEGAVSTVAAADVDGDGIHEALAGTNAGWVYVVGADGERWSRDLGHGAITRATAGDVDGDGRDELFVAFLSYADATPTRIFAFSPTGEQLWTYAVAPVWVEGFGVEQLDDDPELELMVTCGEERRFIYSGFAVALDTRPEATNREQWKVDVGVPVFGYTRLQRDGQDQLALYGFDARVRGVDAATGATEWVYYTGDAIMGIAAGDATGDGVPDFARADVRGNLHLVDGKDGAGIWSRRMQNTNGGEALAVGMGDLDADGLADVSFGGYRANSDKLGFLEVYSSRGAMVWSRAFDGMVGATAIQDLDGDGQGEVIAVERTAVCTMYAFSAAGDLLWSSSIDTCGVIQYLDFADVDEDGDLEIAYSAPPLLEPPDIALLSHEGELLWNVTLSDTEWIEAVPGGVITGGGITEYDGFTGMFAAADGSPVWEHRVERIPDPDLVDWPQSNAVLYGTVAEDQNGDGVFEVIASTLRNEMYLLDGATGEAIWNVWLESKDLTRLKRRTGGPVVYVPATEHAPAWIATAQGAEVNLATTIRALHIDDGSVLAEFPTQSQAYVGVASEMEGGTHGAVFGAGVTTYAIEAVAKE